MKLVVLVVAQISVVLSKGERSHVPSFVYSLVSIRDFGILKNARYFGICQRSLEINIFCAAA